MSVYYSPEKFDLSPVAKLERYDASYEFDMIAVWKHKDGRVLWATDSGCSCPSPFEDYHSIEQLRDAKLEFDEIKRLVDDSPAPSELQKKSFLEAVEAAF